MVYVDFAATQEKVLKLEILKSQKDLYFDDISDMNPNSIYEIPMGGYREGYYTVVLTTQSGITYRQLVAYQSGQLNTL